MSVSEIGEFALIRRLAKRLGAAASSDLLLGIGDDAAVWRAGDQVLLATTDTMVEGVHFLSGVPWTDVGWKALAVNVSDIAAMGGTPLFALVTLALPPRTGERDIEALYDGLSESARRYGVTVAGGDIVRAPQVSVTVALIGRAEQKDGEPLLLRRDCAQAGDVIAVTGTLGDSAAGLRRLKEDVAASGPLARAHLRPAPPLAVAQLAVRLGIICGMDVSDGLLQDVGHICEMSKLGADVHADAVPISAELRAAYPDDALALACSGGEDYQLVLVGPRERVERLQTQVEMPIAVIGEITTGPPRARLLDAAGAEIHLDSPGWDQLRPHGRPSGRSG